MNENLRDALERAAGDDPRVDLTDRVWTQGRVVRRRRQTAQAFGGLAAAGALVGAMWLGGGLLTDPEALPGPAEPSFGGSAVSTVEVDRTTEAPTQDEPTGDATTEVPAQDEPTEDATIEAPTLPIDPCATPYPDPVLLADGLPEATSARASEVLELAAACDRDGLAALAEQDQTFLSFGVVTPEEAFAGPEGAERAAAITILLTLFEPGQEAPDAPYRWPGAVETEDDWTLLVDSGLYTQDEVELLRGSGMGYIGWRVGVDASGQWSFLVAGD